MAIDVQPAVSPTSSSTTPRRPSTSTSRPSTPWSTAGCRAPTASSIHAALNINGSMVMLNDDFPEMTEGKSTTPRRSAARR